MRRAALAAAIALLLAGCATLGLSENDVRRIACEVQCGRPCADLGEDPWRYVCPLPEPPPSSPDPTPTATPPPTPQPTPTAGPVPPSPKPSPCVQPPKPEGCWKCRERLEWEVAHGNLTWDEGRKMYFNDPGNDPSRREWFNRDCCKVFPNGALNCDWFGDICPPDKPCPSPSPQPTAPPTATPPPVPTPTPPTGDGGPDDPRWCMTAPGASNWPLMPGSDKLRSEGGVCPTCWGDFPDQTVTRCGLKHIATRPRSTGGRRYVFDVTCHSSAPRCPHRPDQLNCDVLWACQPPEPAMYQTGPGFELARVDRQSNNPYFGQIHISNPAENGDYEVWACPPGIRPDGQGGDRCSVWRGYVGTDGEVK